MDGVGELRESRVHMLFPLPRAALVRSVLHEAFRKG